VAIVPLKRIKKRIKKKEENIKTTRTHKSVLFTTEMQTRPQRWVRAGGERRGKKREWVR